MVLLRVCQRYTGTLLPFTAPPDEARRSDKTTTVALFPVNCRRWHILKTVRSRIRWQWIRNDLKLRCFIASSMSQVQLMVRVRLCSPSYRCKQLRLTRYIVMKRKRGPGEGQSDCCWSVTAIKGRILYGVEMCLRLDVEAKVLFTLRQQEYIQQAGNTALGLQGMMTHACLCVVHYNICDWSANAFMDWLTGREAFVH